MKNPSCSKLDFSSFLAAAAGCQASVAALPLCACLYARAWRFCSGSLCSARAVIILSWPRESAHCPALKPAPHHLGRADPVLLPARACTKQTTDGMVILSNLSIVRLFHQLATCSVHQLASYLLRVLPGATSVQTHQVPCHTYIHVFASVYIFFHLRMVNNHELGLSLIKIHTPTDLTPHVQFLDIAGRILVLFLFLFSAE